MKILLVEDEYPKRQNILNFLKGLKLDLEISFANSANSAFCSSSERFVVSSNSGISRELVME